jgi:undecaprenyl phosphate N,N'-diacetylbacillosamine 1-phosphate transferase
MKVRYALGKRIIDILISFIGLNLLFPVFVLIAASLKVSSVRRVFFLHKRPGKKGNAFKLIKFKTMNDKKDENGFLLPNNKRITKFGSFLRKYSLDELPQLLNVLKGDISLVGPRPLEMRYLPLYTEEQNKRHLVKPGITGWAQVNGRNAISWEKKFELDVWYVDNQSLSLDLKILLLTVKKVLTSEGVNSDVDKTVEPLDIYLKSKCNEV